MTYLSHHAWMPLLESPWLKIRTCKLSCELIMPLYAFSDATWRAIWLATAQNVTCAVALGIFLANVRWWLRPACPTPGLSLRSCCCCCCYPLPWSPDIHHGVDWCWGFTVTAWLFTLLGSPGNNYVTSCVCGKQIKSCERPLVGISL